MARKLYGDEEYLYRAVISNHYEDGEVHQSYAGPFMTKGAATAAIGAERKHHDHYRRWGTGYDGPTKVTGYVERSPMMWERVESP